MRERGTERERDRERAATEGQRGRKREWGREGERVSE